MLGELLGCRANLIGEIQGLLVDEQFLKLESHSAAPGQESRAVESRPSKEEKVYRSVESKPQEKLSVPEALLLYFLFSTLYWPSANRGDRI